MDFDQSQLIVLAAVVLIIIIVIIAIASGRREKKPELAEKSADEKPLEEPADKESADKESADEESVAGIPAPREEKFEAEAEKPGLLPEAVAEPEVAPEAELEAEPEAEPEVEPEAEPEAEPAEEPAEKPEPEARDEAAGVESLKDERRERVTKLRRGLLSTRKGFIARIGSLFKEKKKVEESVLDEMEEVLITSDVGVKTTQELLEWLKGNSDKTEGMEDVPALLEAKVGEILNIEAPEWNVSSAKPFCIMMVGVNGTGKTTTIGKLASQLKEQGHSVLMAAGDTFRAAAVAQLEIWGRRVDCDVVSGKEGADPSSVIFEAIKKAQKENIDVVIADTAGRLHTKLPLMDELKKIRRVMGKAMEGSPHEVMLVLDATTGQNAIAQAKMFREALDISGIVLTKMDGTAKGGVIIGIVNEEKIPVRFIGIGEKIDDLRVFNAEEFTEALFEKEQDAVENVA